MKFLFEALFLVFVGGAIFFYGAAERPITRSSEGRVARVAQEMLDSGDWIVPHLNGAVRKEKPPLSSWAVALTARALGAKKVTPLHAYIPTGLAGIAVALILYGWLRKVETPGKESFGPFFAGLIALTAPGFLLQARSAELDMLLALFVTLAFLGYWRWRVDHCQWGLLCCYGALALTVLTKGHVGLVIFLPAALVWNFMERAHSALPLRTGGAKWHAAGVALLLLIVLPWAIPFLQNSGIQWEDFKKEGLERFGEKTGHQEPFYFYLLNVPGWMSPWFLLLPAGYIATHDLPPDGRSPLRRLCVCWFLTGFLIFSALTAKQRHYAMPFLPPLVILIADFLQRWMDHPEAAFARGARTAFAGLVAVMGAALVALPGVMKAKGQLLAQDERAVWFVAVMGALLFFWAAWKISRCVCCQAVLAAACVCAVVVFVRTDEKAELEDSPVAFCARVRAAAPTDKPLYDYNVAFAQRVWRAQVLFYLGRKIERVETPLVELSKTPGLYIMANDKWLAEVPKERYDVLVEDHAFLGHDRNAYLIRTK